MLTEVLKYFGIQGEVNMGQILVCITFLVTQTKAWVRRFGQTAAGNAIGEMRLQLVEKNTELHAKELEKLELKIEATKHDTNNIKMSMILVKSKLGIPLSEKEQGAL